MSTVDDDYDHHSKAGNQGDVVKHVALAAALDTILDDFSRPLMRYADLFAGYPSSTLTAENKAADGWGGGVGMLVARRARFAENRHIEWWANHYLTADDLNGTEYPGSAVIASDVCETRDRSISLGLWDIKPAVVRDLNQRFGAGKNSISNCAAEPRDDLLRDANFIFIDPPGIKSDAHPEYPSWQLLRQFIEMRKPDQSLLMWLPVKAVTSVKVTGTSKGVMEAMKPPGEDDPSWFARNDAIRMGCRGLRIRWARGGRTIGCHLIYSLSQRAEIAMRSAVEKVVEIAGWNDGLPNGVQCVIL